MCVEDRLPGLPVPFRMKEIKDLHLDIIFDNMIESMIVVDTQGRILFYNKIASALAASVGRPLRSGDLVAETLPYDRGALVGAIISRVTESRTTQSYETEYKDIEGQSVYFDVVYRPILNEFNETQFISIVLRDITSQKIYEKKIIQLANEITRLIENANAVIFGVDSRGYITEWNKECRRVTKFERNDVYTRSVTELLVDANQRKVFLHLLDTVLGGETISNIELSIKVKDGNPVTILLNANPKTGSSGEPMGALFVGQDVTELTEYRKLLEQKVRDRTKELQGALHKEKELVEIKNRFVSIASHEFKVPLSSISASIKELQSTESKLSDEAHHKLKNIEGQVSHMRALLEDVLTVGKIEVNKLKANIQKIDLVSFFHQITEEVMVSAQRSHKITMDCSHREILIETDEKLLRNIFINLLSNAVKFSPGQNEVLLLVRRHSEGVEIKVKDYGIGIEKMDIERVFEPFNRGSNSAGIKGTGLGLSIVKRAVETLQGNLSVESEVGSGTCFTVCLKI